MFGKRYEYSHSYSLDSSIISYESLNSVFGEISRISSQKLPGGKIRYLLTGDLAVTLSPGTQENTNLWFTGSSRKLPREIRQMLEKMKPAPHQAVRHFVAQKFCRILFDWPQYFL